jgi:hypothetical protein
MRNVRRVRKPKIYNGYAYQGVRLNRNRQYVESYLDRIKELVDYVFYKHKRVLVIHAILRFPGKYLIDDELNYISDFREELQYMVDNHLRKKRKSGKRVHHVKAGNKLYSAWCRERDNRIHDHYHVTLLLSAENFRRLGTYELPYDSFDDSHLSHFIQRAWYNALGDIAADWLVEFPDNNGYVLNKDDEFFAEEYLNLLFRMFYMAKLETKNYGEGKRSFGCSRIPRNIRAYESPLDILKFID